MIRDALRSRVRRLARSVESGEVDPLEVELARLYRELQELSQQLPVKMEIDEALNELLSAKVGRVQELARAVVDPELLVDRVAHMSARELARLLRLKRPLLVPGLSHQHMHQAAERLRLREPRRQWDFGRVEPVERPTRMDLRLEPEITEEEVEEFLTSVPVGEPLRLSDLLRSEDVEEFLRRFLMVVLLVASGDLQYDATARTLTRVERSPDSTSSREQQQVAGQPADRGRRWRRRSR